MTHTLCRALAAVFLLLVAPWGCEAPGSQADAEDRSNRSEVVTPDGSYPLTLEDDAGRAVRLEREPVRIVPLVPAATRVLVELGRIERLVGRTDFDRQHELAALPSVGGGLEPSIERLVSLEPDLVVRFHGPSDPDTPARLDAAGIPHLAVRPDRIEDVLRMIETLGRATGTSGRADALRADVLHEVGDVADRVEGVRRPRAAYLLGGDPPLVAGGGTFLHELIDLAGANNIFAERVDLYAPISVEALVDGDIDVIFVTEGTSVPSALRDVRAIRVPVDAELPGPDVGQSARDLARALHPDRFP